MILKICDHDDHKKTGLKAADYGIETTEENYNSDTWHYCQEHFREIVNSYLTGAMKPETNYTLFTVRD